MKCMTRGGIDLCAQFELPSNKILNIQSQLEALM
jgi:hypothetical protein